MLDDGCPFAAAHFLQTLASGNVSTRVRGIWDQNPHKILDPDQDKKPVRMANGRLFGLDLPDFGYGLEYRRDFAKGIAPNQIGLDKWIKIHSSPTFNIDEEGCYSDPGTGSYVDAPFANLLSRQSHGAHVMDILAGLMPVSSRVGPSSPGDPRDPPTWKPAADDASSADLVFVQFSQECINDATGVWLKDYVVHGINYILSFADSNITERVIINLSYGPTTGPHDGTAVLEQAMTALVTKFDGITTKPKLEIVLAAGNSYTSESHVRFQRTTSAQPRHVEWIWRLPPDNTALCFAEVWVDSAHAGKISVSLKSPTGHVIKATSPPGTASVGGPMVWGTHTMWLVAVDPTVAENSPCADHGDYTIKVEHVGLGAEVHAYVARTDPNMGVRTGAKRSYFIDRRWEKNHSAEASNNYHDGELDKTGSLVQRMGTLNAIATTEENTPVHVAGGFVRSNSRKSTYSSAGPARRGPLKRRHGPDFVLPCDESPALAGIRARGNRSGTIFRMVGTSTAAPQMARKLANNSPPAPTHKPASPDETAKRGGGNIDP